jgi:hypothetical protein
MAPAGGGAGLKAADRVQPSRRRLHRRLKAESPLSEI